MKLLKTLLMVASFSIFSMGLVSCSSKQSASSIPMPKDEKQTAYKPKLSEQWQLSNGLSVMYLPDEELPIIRGALLIPGGTLWEIPGKPALISAMGHQMRQGGAGNLDADELDLQLEKLAAGIESSYGTEYGSIGFSCLTSDFEKVFSLFSDVVLFPKFEKNRLDLWKGQSLESIRRRGDDPNTVAGLSFRELLMGQTPMGRVTVPEDIKSVEREDLLKTHRLLVQPKGAILAITGKIDRKILQEAIERRFGSWKELPEHLSEMPAMSFNPKPGVYFIKKPFEQATVYAGELGPVRLTPDYAAIEGFNIIFGGGDFGSRLMKTIRTDLGLAYSLYGSVLPGFPIGQDIIVLQTKSESTADALEKSIDVLSTMQKVNVEDFEMEQAKKSIQNSFIFKLDTPDDLVRRQALLRLLNYPKDYDETYVEKINMLSAGDVLEVAKKHWDISKLVIVVVGNETAYNSIRAKLQSSPQSLAGFELHECTFSQKLDACN